MIFSDRHCAVIMAKVRDKTSMFSDHLLLALENSRERYNLKSRKINILKLYDLNFVLVIGIKLKSTKIQ